MRRQLRWIVMATALATMSVACSPAMAIGYLSGVLEKPAYVQALTSLLDSAPAWTRKVLKRNGAYVSSVRTTKDIDGSTYELFDLCVPMPKCIDTTIVVMFAPNGTQAWAGLREKGVVSYLGAPSDAQQAVLKRELYVPEPAPKVTSPYLFDVIKKPAYAQALTSLLDRAGKLPSWTREVVKTKGSYKSGTATLTIIDGAKYEIFWTCTEEFSCADTQMAVMFAPNGSQAWALLEQEGAVSYLGAPSSAQQSALREVLWPWPAGK